MTTFVFTVVPKDKYATQDNQITLTLTQPNPNEDKFYDINKEYFLEIQKGSMVFTFTKQGEIEYYVLGIKKPDEISAGGSKSTTENRPNVTPQKDRLHPFPTSPFVVNAPSPNSSGFTDANNSGFSIDSDGTYSFGDKTPDKVRGRFQIASGNDLELVLSEDPHAINLSNLTPQGGFHSAGASRLPDSPSGGGGEKYRLRF